MQIHRLSEELRPLLKFYAVQPKVSRCQVKAGSSCRSTLLSAMAPQMHKDSML